MSNGFEKFIIKRKKPVKLIAKICIVLFVALFGLSMIGGTIMLENADAVNTVFNAVTQIKLEDPDAANKDLEYYKSAFTSVAEVQNNAKAYAETIVAEGSVLLKNNDVNGAPALPLPSGSKVSMFSTSSANPVLSGNGSSSASEESVSLKKGLNEAGIDVNDDLYVWYEDNYAELGRQRVGGAVGTKWSIGDTDWNGIKTDSKTNAEYGDAAIFVLSRIGGEGRDATMYGDPTDDTTDGNYLKLSPKERDVLKNLKKEKDKGTFKRIIVLINGANFVEGEFLDDPELGIDAAMWIGAYGSMGAYAVGDLLVGNVNPSGRLSDTYWKYHYKNPVHANFGMLTADEKDPNEVTQWTITRNVSNGHHIVYQEGIYSGYRYTETRYEDTVLKDKENVGQFDYADTVSYPFGYGLSYADFEYSNYKVTRNLGSAVEKTENTYTVSVDVKNISDTEVSGKEVVQIYLQKPYTQYDKDNGIEKASVELVGFGKTEILAPGEKQTVTVDVDERYFASYDSYNAKTYIVDGGKYYITAARDAHDAVNNILAKKGKSVADGMTDEGDASLVFEQEMNFDDEIYSKSAVTGAEITNQFDNVDLKIYDGAGENKDKFEYVTRSNWEGTVTYGLGPNNEWLDSRVKVTATSKMQEDLTESWNPVVEKDDVEYPTYGSTETSWNLIDLRAFADDDDDPTNDEWIPYDHEMWDELLDQLTFEDTVQLLKCGYRKTNPLEKISKPETIDHNGAVGPVERYNVMSNEDISKSVNQGLAVRKNDPDKGERPVAYPCNGLAASTFNLRLANFYGRQMGENCLWAGYSGLYGFGVNIHRSPYLGRSFEYYSEDPFLTGMISGEETKGMATRGAYVYLKHCFLNDQESYRCGGFTWANEQTCREVYLRAFQIAIEKGGAQCVMGGLNSLGVEWTGTQGFMNTVLRGEFGMTGHAVTDSYGCYNGSYVRGVYYGNDLPDGTMNESNENFDYVKEGGYGKMAWAMREAAHRVLYTVVHSNAMNNYSSGTRIIQITPWWVTMITAFRAVFGTLMGLGIVVWGVVCFFEVKDRIKAGKRS